ncbi:MAG: DUF134 domain-containing protein [Candidatus Methanoliparum thermophilum]|uniref:UPF0251 protein EF806_05060 n=1 Tax=Methanoliparum thermophilum TaxID=2491083 RepID=A0A520KRC0_METT2|nr:DUF134 domain-containing protein [Candidatus Methanoliparum sp. LAM-1]RZN64184.1 MAG: DUF134 domain-containing protein [Candidatus Methanoliparum thermophilum]BDC36634.1 hypothetical protein MTLP_13160 [Candidatus Methanoliparum sp. LAM-1]
MPRRRRCRRVASQPRFTYFKPIGIRAMDLEEVELGMDEFEAIRLKDYLGLEQNEAAFEMGVSQPTFHRIIDEAHRKVAKALIDGLLLRMSREDQVVIVEKESYRIFECFDCESRWSVDYGIPKPMKCPNCGSTLLARVKED